MPTKVIENLGAVGLVKDTPSVQLPEAGFTEANNMRFFNGSVQTMGGEELVKQLETISPTQGIHWRRPDTGYQVLVKDGLFVRVSADGTEEEMFSSVDAAYVGADWQGDLFNGGFAVFFNNGKSTPLYALYGSPTADATFQEFPGWNYAVGLTVTAKVVRPYGYSLVAANLTLDDGVTVTQAPSTVRISVQAATGQFPSIWEPGLTTDTADEFEINSTSPILDMRELRGSLYFYSSDSINVLSTRSGRTQVTPYAKGYGVLSTNCIAEFDGNHFVVDRNDIYIHNGSGGIKSVADGTMKDYFLANINDAAYEKVHVVRNAPHREIWVCYPKGDAELCNEALVFNYRNNTWSTRTLPNVSDTFISYPAESTGFVYNREKPHFCLATEHLLIAEMGHEMWEASIAGTREMQSTLARVKLHVGDPLAEWAINGITLAVDSTNPGQTIEVVVTTSNTYEATVDWTNASGRDLYTFRPDEPRSMGYKVDPRAAGRYLNYRMSSIGPWRLALVGISAQKEGAR